ncbi:hypothetical protein VTN49DRAFT_3290 [Thermomyces lanuginosus]|uniref:uncharacterized protein n=1 Tax=Thermomyces lanuginosus TaxID=5541 RepID=UPI0037425776
MSEPTPKPGDGVSCPTQDAISVLAPTLDASDCDIDINRIPSLDVLKAVCLYLNELIRVTANVQISPSVSQNDSDSGGSNSPTATQEAPAAARSLQEALVRRFSSKNTPSISLEDYLLRIHKYCPMSTSVYLATSLYITRMAVLERSIRVTQRNVHRLVLAGLRVAMKALEDLSYSHNRFSRVGGVSEKELTRLEIAFCFLADFELRVDADKLSLQAVILQRCTAVTFPTLTSRASAPIEDVNRSTVQSASKEIAAGAPDGKT